LDVDGSFEFDEARPLCVAEWQVAKLPVRERSAVAADDEVLVESGRLYAYFWLWRLGDDPQSWKLAVAEFEPDDDSAGQAFAVHALAH
jgi:hypothetical protein